MTMVILGITLFVSSGCRSNTSVVINNTTGIGLEVKYDQASQTPMGWMGYINNVFGIVPTNRVNEENPKQVIGGAQESADVLFETNFCNFFSFWKDNGIYQRVAVGKTAVCQPGATVMFAKSGNSGSVTAEIVTAALNAVKTVTADEVAIKSKIAKAYATGDVAKKQSIIDVLKELGYTNWDAFLDQATTSSAVSAAANALVAKGIKLE